MLQYCDKSSTHYYHTTHHPPLLPHHTSPAKEGMRYNTVRRGLTAHSPAKEGRLSEREKSAPRYYC